MTETDKIDYRIVDHNGLPIVWPEKIGLREYASIHAMQGILANPDDPDDGRGAKNMANIAVMYADALLERLAK